MDELNQYVQTTVGDATTDIVNMLVQYLVVPTIIFMVLFLVVYIIKSVHRHRVDSAILEIRDILRDSKTTKLPEDTKPNSIQE